MDNIRFHAERVIREYGGWVGAPVPDDIVGDYFTLGYDDIMTGVDKLIADGIVDGTKMGALGWSAGGHWSNWILTHTDRFKAISSGAGTSNWISMYAQSDVQRNRQFYLGDKLPYEDFDAYWNQSPLKYIRNAKTPTMIHVVEGDPRVPSPQSVELHMALKKIGVPTELYMYPGNSHGIPDPRNRLVKSVSEKASGSSCSRPSAASMVSSRLARSRVRVSSLPGLRTGSCPAACRFWVRRKSGSCSLFLLKSSVSPSSGSSSSVHLRSSSPRHSMYRTC